MSSFTLTSDKGIPIKLSLADLENLDILDISENTYHILHKNQSIHAKVEEIDTINKKTTIKINGSSYEFTIEDEYDALVKKMGLTVIQNTKIGSIKAPMPGLILEILVETGQEIKDGDSLLILEAMKMENVLKAVGDGVIKSIEVEQSNTVEKGQILIEME